MQIKTFFKVSAIAGALALAGCGGGDINLSSNVDNSTTTTNNNNSGGNSGGDNGGQNNALPGIPNTALTTQISSALGFDVQVQTLRDSISGDVTLPARTGNRPVFYAIQGELSVGTPGSDARTSRDSGDVAKLTIEPGAVLFGQSGNDYVVVHRNATIEANGTAADPIIMTSLQDVTGATTGAGQWGGLVILGNAPSNRCPSDGSDCALQVEGVSEGGVFGGTIADDNSGTLRYVVVKYAGFEIAPDNELNGITFGGVGSGTTVDFIQVHANADDGVEFFGGSVNVKHLVLTGNQDDSVDWDNGFTGKMQHVFIQQATDSSEANRAIEADNDGSTPNAEPRSNPMISNMTIIGNNFDTADTDSEGIYLREGTAGKFYNTVVTGPAEMGECLEFEAGATVTNAESGEIVFENSVMACTNGENFKDAGDFDLGTWFQTASTNADNQVLTSILIDQNGVPDSNSPLIAANAGQDTSSVDAFFDAAAYVGAFDGTNDWRRGWAFGFGGGIVTEQPTTQACPNGTTAITPADGSTQTCQISGRITSDMTLTANNLYALDGAVFVGGDKTDSATLTIEAGTKIFGRSGNDYLVVSRDSQIQANGTAASPITFTSAQDIMPSGTTAPGQWGGLVLLGNAQSNRCPDDGSACALQVEGVQEGAVFGGTDDTDSSGTLRYVVVKHAGFEIAPDNELNGITFGGVGSGTTVEFIQVHENADDGIEFFGGTVNAKYVVLTSNQDDSVDWDNGFRGNLQYVLVKHNPDNSQANRAIEADNDGSNPTDTPQSNPTIANMTIIGNGFDTADTDSEGVYLREGTKAQLYNFVVTGPAAMGECLELEAGATVDQALAGDTVISNSVFACSENFKDTEDSSSNAFDLSNWVLSASGNAANSEAANQGAVLNGIFTIDTTTPRDLSGNSFFDNANHIGAVSSSNNWTAGWTVGLE